MYFAVFGYNTGTNSNPNISLWDTEKGGSATKTIVIPTISTGTYDCTVYWGDGSSNKITSWNDANWTHVYSTAGEKMITISGKFEGFRFNNSGDRLKILDILQWGAQFKIGTNEGAYFYGCENLNISAIDSLNCVGLSSLYLAITNCYEFTRDLDFIDTSNVVSMHGMLLGDINFNKSLNSLNMDNVYSLYAVLYGCKEYNQPIDWYTPQLTTARAMLTDCGKFNSSINLDVSNVTDFNGFLMLNMAFNQTLDSLDFGKGQDFGNFLSDARAFNQDLSNVDFSKGTIFSNTFYNCVAYNSPLPPNLDSAISIDNMFFGNVARETLDLSIYDLSNVTDAHGLCLGCANLTTVVLPSMPKVENWSFAFADIYHELTIAGIETLDVSNTTTLSNFIRDGSISTTSYSSALVYWATLDLQENVVCHMGGSKYNSVGETAKNYIISTFNWSFTDGGLEV